MDENMNYGVTEILLEANKSKEEKNYLSALNKFNEALFFLEGEEKVNTLFSIADLYSEIGDYEKANSIYKQILTIQGDNSGAWYGVAYTNELSGGKIDFTLDAYEKAIELDKNYSEAYYYAAVIYGDQGNYSKGIEYLKKVIELKPDDFIAYNDLGSIYETLGEYEKAEKFLLKSIEINPNYHLSHFNLGVVYKSIGKYEDSIIEYKKALKFKEHRNPYLNMSALYIELNKLEDARKILTEGIEKLEDHILYYNRACVYSKNEEIKLALEDFNKAYEINPIVLEWAKKDPDLKDIISEEQ